MNTDVDVLIHIYQIDIELDLGHSSIFTNETHLGTNKKIEGWKWDERVWPSTNELEASMYAPTIWDPVLSGIEDEVYQSGYGDNYDLELIGLEEVIVSGYTKWLPKINHGYYYTYNEEDYLYSDQYRCELVELSNVVSGIQYHSLLKQPKPTIPLKVRGYSFNRDTYKYSIDIDVRKKVEFSGSQEPEFIVDTSVNPPKLVFNQIFNTAIGGPVSGVDEATDPNDIQALELLGISNGEPNQEFFTQFSPIDPSQPVEIWTWTLTDEGYNSTLISGTDTFSIGNALEAYIDYEHGIVKFGNYDPVTDTGYGRVPLSSMRVGIYYTRGLEVTYEPINTHDYILPHYQSIDLNPIRTATQYGFIQASTYMSDPDHIELTSTLERVNPYLISIGNFTGSLQATVYSANNETLDGQSVVFEILSPIVGTLGGVSTTSNAITANGGVARAVYHSPVTINDVGSIATSSDVVVDGPQTTITFNGLVEPETISGLYVYKIHMFDEVLGLSNLTTYYNNYITEQDYEGVPGTQAYEEDFREHWDLLTPTVHPSLTDSVGKKTLLMTTQSNGVMDTHSGIESSSTYIPLFPVSIEATTAGNTNTLHATYNQVLTIPGVGDTKAYLGIADTIVRVRAYSTNPRNNQTIYSNIIEIKITLPDTLNGTFFANALSEIPDTLLTRPVNVATISDASINATSGIDTMWTEYIRDKNSNETYLDWFRRTRVGDTVGLNDLAETMDDPTLSGLLFVTPQTPTSNITVPLGFRLKSSNISVASILDQITYLDPNEHIPSGLFDIDY